MGAPKVGDRVHVEFDGLIETRSSGQFRVATEPTGAPEFAWVNPERCTVIVPPIKVGDVVTEANIGQLPVWSVIAFADGPSWTRSADNALWIGWLEQKLTDRAVLTANKIPTVLRIGGGA